MIRKSFTLLIVLSSAISFFMVSCSDDEAENPSKLTSITQSELESTPSFVYSYRSNVSARYSYDLYLWFRDGKMSVFKKGATSSSSYARMYYYKLNGQNLTITNTDILGNSKTYKGYLSKYLNGDNKQLVVSQGLDGTNLGNLPDDYLQWYDYSLISIGD